MSRLFDRAISATIGTRKYTNIPRATESDHVGLRMSFDIKKSIDTKAPDKCTISFYNLAPESRTAMQTPGAPVSIEAGYVDTKSLIFKGKVERATSLRHGPTWVTKVSITDGGQEIAAARTDRAHKISTLISDATEQLVKDMKLSLSQASKKILAALKTKDGIQQILNGTAFAGATKDILTTMLAESGKVWKVQDEQVQLFDPLDLPRVALVLSPQTGLIESPEVGEKGRIKLKSLLQPQLRPYHQVKIQSTHILGAYYAIHEIHHVGDTHGSDWYTEVEALPIK